MRASSHNGRWGTERHNMREFDIDKADHIDRGKSSENLYWHWDADQCPDPMGAEERYYNSRFSQALAQQNDKHIQSRHLERIKSMADWLESKNTRPEETIWQIGDKDARMDPEAFAACMDEMQTWQMEWSEAHGSPFQILSTAIHLDEASPHAHQRRVWQYQDKDGTWKIGQNKALEAAGVPLPDPSQPPGPKNNRKMTFDAMTREKWIEICEAHGFQIEREPDPSHGDHIPTKSWKALKEREKALKKQEARLALKEKALTKKADDLARLEDTLKEREKAQEKREADFQLKEDQLEAQRKALADRERRVSDLIRRGRESASHSSHLDRGLPNIPEPSPEIQF